MSEARRNIELKARCGDLIGAREVALRLGARDGGVQNQIDTYFNVSHGRLKLREIDGERAELISYDRADVACGRDSWYRIVAVVSPRELAESLGAACGVRGKVVKRRQIYLYHNVRIHLDTVEGLGTFVEFEAVMGAAEEDATSRQPA